MVLLVAVGVHHRARRPALHPEVMVRPVALHPEVTVRPVEVLLADMVRPVEVHPEHRPEDTVRPEAHRPEDTVRLVAHRPVNLQGGVDSLVVTVARRELSAAASFRRVAAWDHRPDLRKVRLARGPRPKRSALVGTR